MAQKISVVRYVITKSNVTTALMYRFLSMADAQLYIKELAGRAYYPILKRTKNTLMLDKGMGNIMFFKVVKAANIPLNPKEIEKIKEELFIKES